MELDEKLFHALWRYKRRIFKKQIPEHALQLKDVKDRLTIVASMLFGEMVKVKGSKQWGGMVGDTIFCPTHMVLSHSRNANEWSYFHQICFNFLAKNLGYNFKHSKMSSKKRLIITLAMAPSVLSAMKELFPGLYQKNLKYYPLFSLQAQTQNTIRSQEEIFNSIIQDTLDSSTIPSAPLSPEEVLREAEEISHKLRKSGLKADKQKFLQEKIFFPPFFALAPLEVSTLTVKKSNLGQEELKSTSATTTVKTTPKDIVKMVELQEEEDDYNPTHMLVEAVKTAERFNGGMRRVDGSDELSDHADALEELEMSEVVRSKHQTKSIFQADIAYEVISNELNDDLEIHKGSFVYNEWNFRKKSYLKNWCVLSEILPGSCDNSSSDESSKDPSKELTPEHFLSSVKKAHHKHIKDLRRKIENIALSRQWKSRQRDGEEIDLDAAVDAIASIHSGHSPDDKLYRRRHKSQKDVSILILLDASLSSDSWVEGRRVIDTAKETIAILGEALDGLFENVAIMAFNGKTRRQCQYHIVKEFHHKWAASLSRLLAVEPDGYTRIGAALRHSITKIEKSKSQKKAIILLSDGKPTDYDAYEGKYGIHDVRQVIREAKQKDIDIFSLAIDQDAKYYFPQMFGKNNFKVLNHPQQLPDHFIKLFTQLL